MEGRLGLWHWADPHLFAHHLAANGALRPAGLLPTTWLAIDLRPPPWSARSSLHDMTYMAKQASAATREPFIFLMFAAALYLVFTSISLSVLKRINARYSLGTEKVQL